MKILFISCHCLGDALLTTNVLRAIETKYPSAKVTIVSSPAAASLFENYPLLDQLIILEKKAYKRHWLLLWPKLCLTHWDVIIDFRNSIVSRLLISKKYYFKKTDRSVHKIDENISILEEKKRILPKIWFDQKNLQTAIKKEKALKGASYICISPTSGWRGKEWMPESYGTLISELYKTRILGLGDKIVILGAPGERARVQPLFDAVKDLPILDCMGLFEPIESAAVIAGAKFFIGNDSALMHMAWVLGVKTLALLGPAWPEIYAPLGKHSAYVTTDIPCHELQSANKGRKKNPICLMHSLSVEKTLQALRNLI